MKSVGLVLHSATELVLDDFLKQPGHAVILSGSQGIGKTHIARELALQLLQLETLENQAYFRQITPEKGVITIEQVRALITFFRLTVPGKTQIKRVAVLQDAETMGREAQNALLKLLEEPPEGSVLMLTSSYPEKLLPTVRSRAQVLSLPAPTAEQLEAHFKAQQHDEAEIKRVLLRTGGNVAEASKLLNADATADEVLGLVKQVLAGTTYDRLLLVDALAKQKEQTTVFVNTLAATALASLQIAASKNPANLSRWHAILEAADTAEAALERNGNAKLVLTELMLAL